MKGCWNNNYNEQPRHPTDDEKKSDSHLSLDEVRRRVGH